MEPTKPKLPSAAIDLYNLFIHGEISRRDFTEGVQRLATGGLADLIAPHTPGLDLLGQWHGVRHAQRIGDPLLGIERIGSIRPVQPHDHHVLVDPFQQQGSEAGRFR